MKSSATLDANEAVASVAYRLSETIAIYPITPSSPMAEWCDEWTVKQRGNLWNSVPDLVEMQSEAGVAGAIHGMLQVSSLTTTFTCSQGLLLMIPNLYKIAGELLPFCFHVTARTLATHALSIFGDHSDVMACRQTGVAMLASNSVQEAQDLACIAHCATLATRVPFLHFFDGFRTSHEIAKIELLPDEILRAMVDEKWIEAFRHRALTPEHPAIRGTAQNPDVFFQAREACNGFYSRIPGVVQCLMDQFANLTGRRYELFQYAGHPEADRVVVAIGSGAETAEETALELNARGERTGVVKVRLYRPFSVPDFINALPPTVRSIAVLDRTKEPGAIGEPLYLDVLAALSEARAAGLSRFEVEPVVIGGRYGLSSKEFDPAMARAVFDELKKERPRHHFTVGINDDVTGLSLGVDSEFDIESPDVVRAVFFGLGSDGTVGANKNSIKIIGEETPNYAQGYFVYDSKKSGAMTISHLRFGPRPIASHYLIKRANFVACHHFQFLDQYDVLGYAADGATLLLNTSFPPERVWDRLPREVQEEVAAKGLRFFAIDAARVAQESGMGGRINTIMQTCFFAISGVLPRDEAIAQIKRAIEKTYGRKGEHIVQQNFAAVDQTLASLHEIPIPAATAAGAARSAPVPAEAPDFVKRVTATMLAGKGDLLPVSAFPVDGTWPTGTAKWEKRNIADEIPVWEPSLCIQCNKCAIVCPHACIRPKFYAPELLAAAPATFLSTDFRSAEFSGRKYTLQVAPEDCTGCSLCVQVCPAKDKANPRRKAINMRPQTPLRETERENYAFFLDLPSPDRARLKPEVKSSQFFEPLFEYSGACAGCGETPYLKLLTQLFGDRAVIANATGCSSIYGGNLPTTPYTTNSAGRGPAWSNSLFEDNAEYGLGMRFAIDKQTAIARELLQMLAPQLGDESVSEILDASQDGDAEIAAQRERVRHLQLMLAQIAGPDARRLAAISDALVRKSVWIVGGDGWAYDIGFGGLDHVFSLGRDVNILVLDTEVYSNTGGQQSKSTPLGASAKFATAGKVTPKKDLGLIAMSYGSIYVARIALGAKDSQTVKVFDEAERFPGTSLIIAYSHCIAHGYAMRFGLDQQKLAVDSGTWPLYRFDPRRTEAGLPAFQLDSGPPKVPVSRYLANELRFRMIEKSDPARYKELQAAAQADTERRWKLHQQLAEPQPSTEPAP
ncbi:MAG: pyruvate:ferredoxin (flavodoxin) oxidoreductase, partial [Terrimicrobiaceae bacterium]|nr:pyruvate:ferredoxin (flavodoxin) oxidoreductase [Terrimicrobiaceae bacterium]